jgi:hypothetical protein
LEINDIIDQHEFTRGKTAIETPRGRGDEKIPHTERGDKADERTYLLLTILIEVFAAKDEETGPAAHIALPKLPPVAGDTGRAEPRDFPKIQRECNGVSITGPVESAPENDG